MYLQRVNVTLPESILVCRYSDKYDMSKNIQYRKSEFTIE